MTTIPDLVVKAGVQQALDNLRAAFPDWVLTVLPDGQGGAWVEVASVPLGAPYVQGESFLIFLLPFTLPGSDIYPMFVRADLARIDGGPLGDGFQQTEVSWPGEAAPRPIIQVSRRTRGAFAAQTASQKVAKVLDWMRSR
ncbi:hypothetical protein [Nocardioides terrisoli]|uniref:hypothetical protein n=1 Tax=Nocardioides terrisoli TaxID=3388267 RepID=UPI00287B7997|nr:hypothetical protein [Nocardioides marmorisolisilvae]